jgi:L-alanine-DL-glutamate epimerase-like enolase superfamily enzyme
MDSLLGGNMFTKSGMSIALWDAYARNLDVTMAEALGGIRRREVRIKCSLSGGPEYLRRAYDYATAMGFTAFKVKVGLDVEGDIARVALARQLAGAGTFLGTDANTGWSRKDALRAIEGFAPHGVAFIEQPVAAKDLAGMASLRGHGYPIIADESVGDIWDLRAVIGAGAADVISLYVGMSGGPSRTIAMGEAATAAGLEIVIGSNGEMGIGAAAQLQVACALPGLSTRIPSDIIGSHFYSEETLATPLNSDGARVVLGDGAGLGVEPRPDLVEQFA